MYGGGGVEPTDGSHGSSESPRVALVVSVATDALSHADSESESVDQDGDWSVGAKVGTDRAGA